MGTSRLEGRRGVKQWMQETAFQAEGTEGTTSWGTFQTPQEPQGGPQRRNVDKAVGSQAAGDF